MTILVNDNPVLLKDGAVLADLPNLKNKDGRGMAVALNGRLVKYDNWELTSLKDADTVLIINAAFGG